MSAKFIELNLRSHIISHGYDVNNKEVTEEVISESFFPKIIAVGRIKSISDKYVLTDYTDGRWIYWEYQESYESVRNQLLE